MKTISEIEGMDTVITKQWLEDRLACEDVLDWAVSVIGEGMTVEDMLPHFERADWLLWLLKRSAAIDKITYAKIAIKCAESVISIYEKRYPNDERPRKAIEAAIAYVKDPSNKNREAASAASAYAYAAASAASAAAYASAYASAAYAASAAPAYAYAAAYAASAAPAYAYAAASASSAAASYSADAAAAAAAAYAYADAAAASAASAASAAYAASAAASAAYADARKEMHKKLCAMIIEELEGKK